MLYSQSCEYTSPQSTLEHIHHPRKKPRACQPLSSASYIPPSPKQLPVYFCVRGFTKHWGFCSNPVLHPLDHCWVLGLTGTSGLSRVQAHRPILCPPRKHRTIHPQARSLKLKTSGGGGGAVLWAVGRFRQDRLPWYSPHALPSSSHTSYICFFPWIVPLLPRS